MAAPKGNQYWKLASRHGRKKIFSTPDILWSEAKKYFDWADSNPIIQKDYRGSKAVAVDLHKRRPYTWKALELFLGIHSFEDYKSNERYKEFTDVIARIDKIIYCQKFDGASVGEFDPRIISRDLGLIDKRESSHEITRKSVKALFSGLDDSE